MEPIYQKKFEITGLHTDCLGRLKPSAILFFVQEAAGEQCNLWNLGWDALQKKKLFWAIIRHKVQITRLPKSGEIITLETWPMPTTRTAYPRSVVAYDEGHNELFRTVSLWVLMDPDTRAIVLPRNSGVEVLGVLRGTELTVPGTLVPGTLGSQRARTVCFTDLDLNGHMNNGRYLDWVYDLLPSPFHRCGAPRQISLNYHAEAREGDELTLRWELGSDRKLQVQALRQDTRIFTAVIEY